MKIIFCYNNISYTLAKEININNNGIIILFKSRIKKDENVKIFQIYYNKFLTFFILILSYFFSYFEIIIPHTNGGKLIKLISSYSRNISYIDDGMDTFRDIPKNIDINNIKNNTKYYTFKYNIPTANWLDKFLILKIADLLILAKNTNNICDYNSYKQLIIESNGVNLNNVNNIKSTLLIKHPSKIKNLNSKINILSIYNACIESTLLNYEGKIIIGETMVLIFLFQNNYDKSKIILHLNKSDYSNLSCLYPLFEKCEKLILN